MTATILDGLPTTRKAAKVAGVKHYFTGRCCPRGHVSRRFVSTGACFECCDEKRTAYRKADPERSRKAYRDYCAANLDKVREASRAWKRNNPERNAAIHQAWCKDHPDYFRRYQRMWRAENPDQAQEVLQVWREANPEKVLAHNRNRRARKRGAEGSHTAEDVSTIRNTQKDRCVYCNVDLKGKGHLDHIKPLVKGGSNWPKNLQLLCQPCNQRKHARDPIEFAQSLGMLT